MHRGWLRLYRKIIDSRIFKNERLLKVWIWCLCQANYEDTWVCVSTGRSQTEVFLKRGQFLFGRTTAAKELNMPESTVRNKIKKLKNMEKLTIQGDAHYSIVSIINYDIYQNNKEKVDRQVDNQKTTKGLLKGTESKILKCPAQKIIDIYHETCPELPRAQGTDTIKKKISTRWREDKERQSLDWWTKFFTYWVADSDFLMGKRTDFQANLAWIMGPQNFLKILNGQYANRKSLAGSKSPYAKYGKGAKKITLIGKNALIEK